jgi:hypothetical protein
MPPPKVQARFIEPMLLVRTETVPESDGLVFELKLDGFRAVAFGRKRNKRFESSPSRHHHQREPGDERSWWTLSPSCMQQASRWFFVRCSCRDYW